MRIPVNMRQRFSIGCLLREEILPVFRHPAPHGQHGIDEWRSGLRCQGCRGKARDIARSYGLFTRGTLTAGFPYCSR